ncbi:MAG TPA: type II toxin-antitoxin system RelE/ParE family toxin [Anaerohalosphaeraceae bacterium]|nr:type II toxin-antitoxin system RelE/ParE family toxin [Anaerohalosphaeraceae bacterium]
MPAKEFLESLDKRDRTKLVRLFDRMRQKGEIKNPEKFKKLKGCNQLYEFKSKPFRILTFRKGYTWFLTNGFKKDDDETPREEIKRGVDIMQEHLSRS